MSGNGDYISREEAFNAILKLVPKVDDDGYCWIIRGDAATAIDSIPAADVRPVVLCCDCKHFQINVSPSGYLPQGVPEWECRHWCRPTDPTDFCSYGEKREEC
jgi:hypothetical protein